MILQYHSMQLQFHCTVTTIIKMCVWGCIMNLMRSVTNTMKWRYFRTFIKDRKFSTIVRVFVCQAGHPGLSSASERNKFIMVWYEFLHPCYNVVLQKLCHVLSCLCDNAFIGFLAIWHRSSEQILVPGFSLFLYCHHAMNGDVNINQSSL